MIGRARKLGTWSKAVWGKLRLAEDSQADSGMGKSSTGKGGMKNLENMTGVGFTYKQPLLNVQSLSHMQMYTMSACVFLHYIYIMC